MKKFKDFLKEEKQYTKSQAIRFYKDAYGKKFDLKNLLWKKDSKGNYDWIDNYSGELLPIKGNKQPKDTTEYLKEEVSTSSISSTGALAPIKPAGKAFGLDFFEVDCDTFDKCRSGGKKHRKHWMKFLGNKDIQQYAKTNKKPFLIKRSGYEQYLRAR